MRTLVVASSKGGAGKTTLAVHLAVVAAGAGHTPLIIDADPQASSLAWYSARDADIPEVVQADPSDNFERILGQAGASGFTLALVDTQPRASASLTRIVRCADFVVVPMRCSPLDLATAPAIVSIVTDAGKPFAFVLNACPARVREVAESRAALEELGRVCAATIGDRIIFSRALAGGLACSEFDPASLAALEIEHLWTELARRANVDVSPSRAQV